MIIKSIVIENFRQYKNTNLIEFSTDPDKNVTIILGINTSGKTTIIQAFNWCLYGTTSFKSKEMLLNSEMAANLPMNGYATVRVKIVLNHENREFTISRSQNFYRLESGKLRPDRFNLSVSYKEPNGNTYPISESECSNTINKILPEGLSDYFFFDGERIQDINNKRDVVSAVRGLMGLDIVQSAVDHLNPNSSASVIYKMRKDLSIESEYKSSNLSIELDEATNELEECKERLENINNEIDYAKEERTRLSELLKGTAEIRELQNTRERLIKSQDTIKQSIVECQNRLLQDFSRDYFVYFYQPLIKRVKKVLDSSSKPLEGIPEMNIKAIQYILKRGKCICGCDLTKNQGAVENIQAEGALLPPAHIGTIVKSFNDTCELLISNHMKNQFSKTIAGDYSEIRRYERRLDETIDELNKVSEKIKKLGSVNTVQIENDYRANEQTLETKQRQRGALEEKISKLSSNIDDINKAINSLAANCDKNKLLRREIDYATSIYQWFKDSYDKQEKEVKDDLLQSVNIIFDKMYHGSRKVTIDNNYRIQLITSLGDKEISTDESKGLEAVKNFSFISGLVDLARKKARQIPTNSLDEPELFSTEPYPIVMDAPFSNVDEIHINNISRILPEIAEQVILIVMNKDWAYAKETMGSRVGASYIIEKINNSDTYSTIRRTDNV